MGGSFIYTIDGAYNFDRHRRRRLMCSGVRIVSCFVPLTWNLGTYPKLQGLGTARRMHSARLRLGRGFLVSALGVVYLSEFIMMSFRQNVLRVF